MIYTDIQIRAWAELGGIDPFDETCLNPASIDLKIGTGYRKPVLQSGNRGYTWGDQHNIPRNGIALSIHNFVLCHSIEHIKIPHNVVAKLFLKSSAGRRGLEHLHACYIDPGFEGQLTFELCSHWPGLLMVDVGERILQMTLEECVSPALRPYSETGHYQGQTGATPPYHIKVS